MDFLQISGKRFLVFGVANRKSVAYAIARTLEKQGAEVIYVVRSEQRRESLGKLLEDRQIHVCDVEFEDQIASLVEALRTKSSPFDGIVHSIAFANRDELEGRFCDPSREGWRTALDVSAYSLTAIARRIEPLMLEVCSRNTRKEIRAFKDGS